MKRLNRRLKQERGRANWAVHKLRAATEAHEAIVVYYRGRIQTLERRLSLVSSRSPADPAGVDGVSGAEV